MTALLDAAKAYLAAGFHPFPVEPSGKRPLISWRQYADRAPTEAELERWWTETPNANVGLALKRGQWVLDVDGDEGREALWRSGFDVAKYQHASVSTGKGDHFYFAGDAPNGVAVLPSVDVRGYGGYTVAPPSVHASGSHYAWWVGTIPAGLRPAPSSLLSILETTKKTAVREETGNTDSWLHQALAGVAEGGRDQTCTRLAGYLLGKNLPADVVETMLVQWGERCSPEFPADQVAKCVASIAQRHVPEAPALEGGPAITDFVQKMLAPNKPKRVVSTGLAQLDKALNGGLYPGSVTLFAGIGGVGKSVAAQMIAMQTAEAGGPVLFAALEMPAADVLARLLSYFGSRDSKQILAMLHGQEPVTDFDRNFFPALAQNLSTLPFNINGKLRTLAALDAALAQKPDTRLLVVDQLQHLKHDGMAGLEANSRGLVELAEKYDIPILAISQVNRPEGKDRGNADWRPNRYSLRGSEQLYHDASVVILFHRAAEDAQWLEIRVDKNRMSGSGPWMKVEYHPQFCKVGE